MVFGVAPARVELRVSEVEPSIPGQSAGGDVHLIVHADVHGFSGTAHAWIDRDRWAQFRDQLFALERARQGEATLDSISPGELRLRFYSADRLGHMAVAGEVRQHFYGRDAGGAQELMLKFGAVEFDPSLLTAFVAEVESLDNLAP